MNVLAFDTEARGFKWWGGETAFIATAADAENEWVYDLSDDNDVLNFASQLDSADHIIGHNLKFDAHQVRATIDLDILELDAEFHDTEIGARIWWPESKWGDHGGFGLKPLAKCFIDPEADVEETALKDCAKQLGYKSLKSKPGIYYEIWRAYPDILEAYALKDARYTYDLFTLLQAEAEKGTQGQRDIYGVEQRSFPIFVRAEQRGTQVNRKKVTALLATYKQREKDAKRTLTDDHGMPENALGGEGSEAALPEWLLKQGVPLTERTDSGDAFSTSKYALQKFADAYPVIDDFLEFRTIEKFLGTYIEPMLNRDVVHPSFRQIGAWTGRSSCAEPNMQNIPVRSGNEVREVFEARRGYKLVSVDFDSIEMRILAYYLGREGGPYRDLINSGHDPHAWMAAQLAAAGVPVFTYGTDPASYAKGTDGEKQRALAKSVLFAIVYGAGGRRLCDMTGLPSGPPLKADDWMVHNTDANEGDPSYAQGRALARQVKKNIPGYAMLMKRIRTKIETLGYVTTLCGRKQAVAYDKAYVGMSALIQGTAADIMKLALIEVNACLNPDHTRILLVIHDEVLLETPEDVAGETLLIAQSAMTRSYDLDPPLLTSGTICDNYGEAK